MTAASPPISCLAAPLVNAYSTIGGRGATIMPTPMAAIDARARSMSDLSRSPKRVVAGARSKTRFQVSVRRRITTPCRAAALRTLWTLALGTVHT